MRPAHEPYSTGQMVGYVYLIRNGDLHKIGRTNNPEKRFRQLKPDEVIKVARTDRSRDLEYELHQMFKDKRLPQTEYFRLAEADVMTVALALDRTTSGWQSEYTNCGGTEMITRVSSRVRAFSYASTGMLILLLGGSFFVDAGDMSNVQAAFLAVMLAGLVASLLGLGINAAEYVARRLWIAITASKR